MSRWYVDQKETRNVGRRIGAGAAILLLALGGTSGMAARAAPACPQSVGTRCSTAPSAPSTRQSSAAPAAQARAVPDGTVATISVAARLTKYYPHIPGIYNLGLPRLGSFPAARSGSPS
jgi:hypothetical protein